MIKGKLYFPTQFLYRKNKILIWVLSDVTQSRASSTERQGKKIEQLSLNHYHQNVEVEWHQCQQFFWLNKMGDK